MRMKKVYLAALALLAIASTACKKDPPAPAPPPTTQDFYVNVLCTKSGYLSNRIATPSSVYLFQDTGKKIDTTISYYHTVKQSQVLMYQDGTTSAACKYMAENGANTFTNIPDGDYIIWVTFSPIDKSGYYAAMRKIKVNVDYRWRSENMLFNLDKDPGFYEWDNPYPDTKGGPGGNPFENFPRIDDPLEE